MRKLRANLEASVADIGGEDFGGSCGGGLVGGRSDGGPILGGSDTVAAAVSSSSVVEAVAVGGNVVGGFFCSLAGAAFFSTSSSVSPRMSDGPVCNSSSLVGTRWKADSFGVCVCVGVFDCVTLLASSVAPLCASIFFFLLSQSRSAGGRVPLVSLPSLPPPPPPPRRKR